MNEVNCPEGGRHELRVSGSAGCIKCGIVLSDDERQDLLNAAMQLTADEATATVSMFEKFDWPLVNGAEDNMDRHDEYARRWRGDTEVEDE